MLVNAEFSSNPARQFWFVLLDPLCAAAPMARKTGTRAPNAASSASTAASSVSEWSLGSSGIGSGREREMLGEGREGWEGLAAAKRDSRCASRRARCRTSEERAKDWEGLGSSSQSQESTILRLIQEEQGCLRSCGVGALNSRPFYSSERGTHAFDLPARTTASAPSSPKESEGTHRRLHSEQLSANLFFLALSPSSPSGLAAAFPFSARTRFRGTACCPDPEAAGE